MDRRQIIKGGIVAAGVVAGVYVPPTVTQLSIPRVGAQTLSPWQQSIPPLQMALIPSALPPSSTPVVDGYAECVPGIGDPYRGWFIVRSAGVGDEVLKAVLLYDVHDFPLPEIPLGEVRPDTSGLLVPLQILPILRPWSDVGAFLRVPAGPYRLELRRADGTVVVSKTTGIQACG